MAVLSLLHEYSIGSGIAAQRTQLSNQRYKKYISPPFVLAFIDSMHCKKCKKYYVKKGVTISNRFLIWKTLNSFKTLVFKHYLKIPNFEKLSFLTVCMWSLWLVWVTKMQWLACTWRKIRWRYAAASLSLFAHFLLMQIFWR